MTIQRTCIECGRLFALWVTPSNGHETSAKYCPGEDGCRGPALKRARREGNAPPHPRERPIGTRTETSTGYVTVKVGEGHPYQEQAGWTAEHRLAVAESLGRRLVRGENVHHINGDRSDNRLKNLELWYKTHPAGQRIPDLISYLVTHHEGSLREALSDRP